MTSKEFPSPVGDYDSSHFLEMDVCVEEKRMFPSPVGDYDSSLFCSIQSNGRKSQTGFRPLSGIMILHWKGYIYQWQDSADLFPSPVGDYDSSLR